MNRHADRLKRTLVTWALTLSLSPALLRGTAMAQEPPAAEESPSPAGPADTAEPQAPASPSSPAAPAAAPAETEPTFSEADVEALMNEAASGDKGGDEGGFTPDLRFYGFIDASMTGVFLTTNDLDLDAFLGPGISFRVGNINLYADARLTESLRSMLEVRFTYLPHGSLDLATLTRVKFTSADYTQTYRSVHTGSIIIERADLEYGPHSLFNVRAGHFISPVGIWNADHSTVVIVPIGIPYPVGEGLIPLNQTGLEVFGSTDVGNFTLGYDLTVSNGRGSAAEYLDLDKNKGFGGRLYASFHRLGTWTLGVSGYKGRATYADVRPAEGGIETAINMQYDEVAGAADFQWKWGGLLLQSEFLVSQVAFTEEGRPSSVIPTGAGLVPDFTRFGL